MISPLLSLDSLRQDPLSPAIQSVADIVLAAGLQPHGGPMSPVAGEVTTIFAALQEAFVHAAGTGNVVMTVALPNA